MEIRFFDSNIEKFIKKLDKLAIAKVLRTLDLLERFGSRLGMPYSKCIDKGLFELRIHGRQEVRIMYCFHNGEAVLVHAFIKKTQKPPRQILKLAKSRQNQLGNT